MNKSVLNGSEDILWHEFCKGDEASFEEIVRRYYPKLYRYATRVWPDDAVVRDCLQEIFADLWFRKEELAQITSVNYYLIGAVRNRLHFERRKLKLNVDIEDWSEAEVFISEFSIETELILQEDQKQKVLRLNTLINALSARQREVIHLRFFDELDHDQIADMMGLNRQSVYNLLHETIRRLRNMWFIILIHII